MLRRIGQDGGLVVILAALALLSKGTSDLDDVLGGKGEQIANAFLRAKVEQMVHLPTPPSTDAFEEVRKTRKRELMRCLGLDPMPPRTPLNARITGVIHRTGFRIEKLVFESRPRFYVTAHVYVPEPEAGLRPVIMNVNGHWAHKKDEDRIQLRCQFQALQGYLAIAVDSPGFSFEGNHLIERRAEGDHNDFALVEGGTNTTGYYVWDTIRALDYMATRPDADMTRVGITGASGGGLATLYAFAADDRYKAAVPVVYMSSMELAPDNGCLCNHVPGTCQMGDRSDVIAIQAPKPVFIMGAQDDGEFPPDAMRLTRQKMAETWALFGKADDTYVQIYPGPHDYNKSMRESMIGFFDRYLRRRGDGSPVVQPDLTAIDPDSHLLLALDPPPASERTMRDLSKQYLKDAPKETSARQAIRVNGGIPERTPLNYAQHELSNGLTAATFEAEPGLVTPAILRKTDSDLMTIYVDDAGKKAVATANGRVSALFVDVLGTGEFSSLEMRYPVYMGCSVPFLGGWQIVRAAEAMQRYAKRFRIVAHGPISTQAAMWASLMDGSFESVEATVCLKEWADVFEDGVSPYAIQPRANLCGSLAHLRSLVKGGKWE